MRRILILLMLVAAVSAVRADDLTPEARARQARAAELLKQVKAVGFYGMRDPGPKLVIEEVRGMGKDAAPAVAEMLATGLKERKRGWIEVYRPLYVFQGMGKESLVALPDLIRALEDDHPVNIGQAAKVLQEIGPAARKAFPALLAAWKAGQRKEWNAMKPLAAAMKAIDPQAAAAAGVVEPPEE